MPHVFPGLVLNAPEGKSAMREMLAFWAQRLTTAKP
jgi:hypothetical protein